MSVIGNFSFNNYDRTLNQAGPGSPTTGRRYGRADNNYFLERKISSVSPAHVQKPASKGLNVTSSTGEQHSLDDYKSVTSPRKLGDGGQSEEVKRLARQYSRTSNSGQIELNPFEARKGSTIDPNSDNFEAKEWIRSMIKLSEQSEADNMGRCAGIAFRNLSAYGFGAATDYQKSVGNIFFDVVGLARRLASMGQRKIDILQNFAGLVHAGEMLVVLGPPASGCSTFLKTIAGETDGFVVGEDSYLNFQGDLILPNGSDVLANAYFRNQF
jgi:ATP-binding cassette subfamily G (WHITE) protein 2 (PDR)